MYLNNLQKSTYLYGRYQLSNDGNKVYTQFRQVESANIRKSGAINLRRANFLYWNKIKRKSYCRQCVILTSSLSLNKYCIATI
ncbi:hypothetical protein GJ496_006255, partial [Pomphorhynchus laevis]